MTEALQFKPQLSCAYKRTIQFLVEQTITQLPVDPFELCKRLDLPVVSVQEFCRRNNYDEQFMLEKVLLSDYGASIYFRDRKRYCIVYNDRHSIEDIRWTIAHELGHIVLGHLNEGIQPGSAMTVMPRSQYDAIEAESNMFARTLLVPTPLVRKLHPLPYQEIAKIFVVSDNTAKSSILFSKGVWRNYEKEESMEKALLKQFSKELQTIQNA